MIIAGLVSGAGGDALASHLLKLDGQIIIPIESRGLLAKGLRSQIAEIENLALAGRSSRPLLHIHCDPHPQLSADANKNARERYWALVETEFGLNDAPYCGVIHFKHGRRHEHRVYCAIKENGRVINTSFDYLRETAARCRVCWEQGLSPPPSPHLKAVAKRMAQQGETQIASWLLAGAAAEHLRRIAKISPRERQQQERTGVTLESVRAATLSAWYASDTAEKFVSELEERGLKLACGTRVIVVVDEAGGTHSLTRVIGAASRKLGARIRAHEVNARLKGFEVPTLIRNKRRKPDLAIPPNTQWQWGPAIEQSNWESEEEEVLSPTVPGEDTDIWGVARIVRGVRLIYQPEVDFAGEDSLLYAVQYPSVLRTISVKVSVVGYQAETLNVAQSDTIAPEKQTAEPIPACAELLF